MRAVRSGRRSSVSWRLTAGLLALAGTTVVAAGLSLYGIERFRQGFDRIADDRVAALVGVAGLAQQAQAIAVTAPRLAATLDRFERERAMRHLDDLLSQLDSLFTEYLALEPRPDALPALQRYRQEFVDNLHRLDGLVAERHAGEQRLRARIDALSRLAREVRETLSALDIEAAIPAETGAPAADGDAVRRAAHDWLAAFDEAITAALIAATAGSEGLLAGQAGSQSAALERTGVALGRLPPATAARLAPYTSRLAETTAGPAGLLAARAAQLAGQQQIQGALNRIGIVSGQFVAATSNLFADARRAIDQDRADFRAVMRSGANLLVTLVVSSLVAAALIFLFVRRRVIARLLGLQRCMRARADGRPVPIPTSGNDELSDMAAAFAFFVGEVERRQTELRAAKDAAERAVHDLREAQDQLVEREKMAALGGLVAGVAHEINTPIGVALTAASFIAERTTDMLTRMRDGRLKRSEFEQTGAQIAESCTHLMTNIDRAATLIQSFKQVAADQTSGDRRRFRVLAYLGAVVASLDPRLRAQNVRVRLDGPEEVEIDTFPGALSQVVTNLMMNSLMHALDRQTGGTIEIRVQEPEPGLLQIEVTDNGSGMPAEVLQRIFEPFFTTRRGRGGTGLGLHIVHNLVTNTLGGRISVTSAPGAGTTFRVRLPAEAPAAAGGDGLSARATAPPD